MHKTKWPNILQPFLPNFQLTSQIKFGIHVDWMILLILLLWACKENLVYNCIRHMYHEAEARIMMIEASKNQSYHQQ